MSTTVEVIAEAIKEAGTPFIAGHPGGESVELMDALRQRDMRFLLMKQEVAGAMLAATWGEITGSPGVCLSTRGPGAANMVNGVAYAALDRAPLIAITDQYSAPTYATGLRQRIDQLGATALAKWRAAKVGFVFQLYNLMPMLSAQRNVELPLLLTKLSNGERKKRAAIALQLVGLADRAVHKPAELSGGQQQRVSIARAIVSDPALLVCDEPTGDLDRQSAEDVLGLLRILNRDHGKTIVMVTHDPKAADYAKHTLHLDKGSLVEPVTA